MHYNFGIGYLAGIPSGTNPTPIQFGLIKDISLDFKTKLVQERGQWRYAVAVGAGETDITGKIGSVSLFGASIGQVLGVTPSAGATIGIPGETATIPGTPFQVTTTNPVGHGTPIVDHGVLDNTTGLWMTRGATSTGTGVYAMVEATGVYTFNTADATHNVQIAYGYTIATGAKTVGVTNLVQNLASGIQLVCYGPTQAGGTMGFKLYNAFLPDLGFAMKPGDFTAQNVSFFAAQDSASTKIIDLYTGE